MSRKKKNCLDQSHFVFMHVEQDTIINNKNEAAQNLNKLG